MYTLEYIPDEIALQILNLLRKKDLQTLRLVSFTMRLKIDRLFAPMFNCINLTDKNLRDFQTSRRTTLKKILGRGGAPPTELILNIYTMKVGYVSQFDPSLQKVELNFPKLRSMYFVSITELQFSDAIGRKYFHQILEQTENLQVLKLNSAVLGGTANLFGINSPDEIIKPRPSFPRILESCPVFIKKLMKTRMRSNGDSLRTMRNLLELHITLDYICPSSRNFSPFILVENLKSVREIPTYFLRKYVVTVEKSDREEQFFFTVSSLLSTIPVRAYECLKTLSFVTAKCRKENGASFEKTERRKEKKVMTMTKFSEMKLNEFQFIVIDGYMHDTPGELEGLVASQKYLEKLDLSGIA